MTAELLQPEELVSGIICQVAAEPELAQLLCSFVYNTNGEPGVLRGRRGALRGRISHDQSMHLNMLSILPSSLGYEGQPCD